MKKIKLTFLLIAIFLLYGRNFAQTYNYAEVLQKSMFFYECQRSGTLPSSNRVNWRGNSGLHDGSDVSIDLTGGLHDAGDHVKFGLPLAYTATTLAWGAIDFQAGYTASGQLSYLKSNLRWITDYLLKCHTAPNELYAQVGDAVADHGWWGSCEVMQMARPSYKIDAAHPGSDLAGETAAALAAASIVFASDDPAYSATLLSHAKQLYTFADTYRGKYSDIIPANPYYTSYSGYQDELVWGAIWLYKATNDAAYLTKATTEYDKLSMEGQSTTDHAYKWTMSWDDKTYGCYILMSKLTGNAKYMTDAEHFLDYWTDGYNGSKGARTPGGLIYVDSWGSCRYASNTAFLAMVYSGITTDATKKAKYYNFAVSQIKYILGSNPMNRSLICGFGTNPPINPHHRTGHGAWANNLVGPPTNSRHTLYGAMVGGPDASDGYADSRSNFNQNEPACDYNALFSGILAKLVIDNGGTPLANFPTPEVPTNEFLVGAKLNGSGSTYSEYDVWVNNHTAWPSRIPTLWKFRIFVNITEGLAAGYKATDYVISSNENNTTFTGLQVWDASKNVYYTEVTFNSGIVIWPGDQSGSQQESQIRIRLPYNSPASAWDPTNDPSYQGLASTLDSSFTKIPLYVDGKLVAGIEPPIGNVIPVTGVSVSPTTASISVGSTSQLTATVAPSNATNQTVTWGSNNTAVATVSSTGLVMGVASGTTTITVTTQDGAKIATCEVSVTSNNIPVTGVTVSPATASIGIGGTQQLTATVSPSNATNQTVIWSSSNTSVATVSSTGVVTGVATGSATITVTTVDGSKTATSAITVANIPVTGVTVAPATASIGIGGTQQLTATVLPANAGNKNVSWLSSNTSVATVSSTGLVTGVAIGSATITVTTVDGAKTATSVITVSNTAVTGVSVSPTSASMSVGATQQLTATVSPANATNKNVTWASSNTAVATVSSTGLVTGVAGGTATITVTTVDGGFTATCAVTVSTCNLLTLYNAPLSSPLPNINTNYKYIYVLGSHASISNITQFTINWDLANNGLYQFSINTNNGVPNWYVDLRSTMTFKFNAASPYVTITGSGAGLDGDYYVATDNGNFVMIDKLATYAIYFSNSATAPQGCGNHNTPVTGVSVSPTSASILVGGTQQLTATVLPSNATNKSVTWSSSNTSVATVGSTGVVTGIAIGTSTITVTTADGGFTATSAITVTTSNVPVTGVSVSPTVVTNCSGGTFQLTVAVAPSNATNKNVIWSSSNIAIATVSSTGLVTFVAAGTATITVTTVDGGFTASCSVTVSSCNIPVTGVTVSPTSASIAVGATQQLTATVLPSSATNKGVAWSTSSSAIATVSSTGLVTGVAAGSATITVTTADGGFIATSAITVAGACTTCGCNFGTPTATALPSVNKSYNYAYVLGTGGPNLSNLSNFTINWDLSNNGLYQFSMLTKDGKPNWYNDLRTGAAQNFASAQPAITLSGTGFPGLDGSYYATVYNGDFVLVSKTSGFTIYFSNSTTAPTCNTKGVREVASVNRLNNGVTMFPNPVDKDASITISLKNQGDVRAIITDLNGKIIVSSENLKSDVNSINLEGKLSSGIYLVRIMNGNDQSYQKLIVK